MKKIDPNSEEVDLKKVNIEATIDEILYENHAGIGTSIDEAALRRHGENNDVETIVKAAKMVRSLVVIND